MWGDAVDPYDDGGGADDVEAEPSVDDMEGTWMQRVTLPTAPASALCFDGVEDRVWFGTDEVCARSLSRRSLSRRRDARCCIRGCCYDDAAAATALPRIPPSFAVPASTAGVTAWRHCR
jgi:hypothetical protein